MPDCVARQRESASFTHLNPCAFSTRGRVDFGLWTDLHNARIPGAKTALAMARGSSAPFPQFLQSAFNH